MAYAIARMWRWFSLGFIVAFVVYLFVRWEADKVFTGVGVAVVVGLVVAIVLEYLRNKMQGDRTQRT